MRAGILLIVLYWALFTIREGLQPKVAAEVKAATYDMKRASGLEKLEHTRRLQCWTVAKWALRVCGWAENVLLGAVRAGRLGLQQSAGKRAGPNLPGVRPAVVLHYAACYLGGGHNALFDLGV